MARFLFDLLALFVVGGLIAFKLTLRHRRASAALVVAKYHARGDALGWQRVSLIGRKDVRVCPDCGTFTHDYGTQEAHSRDHQAFDSLSDRVLELEKLVAEMHGGKRREDVKPPPWTAVVEPEAASNGAVDVTQDTLSDADRAAQWAPIDGMIGHLTGKK